MVEEADAGCTRPESGPVAEAVQEEKETRKVVKEERSMVQVGKRPRTLQRRVISRGNL